MNPFYFGESATQLFGIHHPPDGAEVRDAAVLLCPPLGHEYIAAHRPLQQLGTRLARSGFHVMRFDFHGCGDSAGDGEDARLSQWVDDVGTAVEELRDTSGARRVTVVGLRLGASLAALAAARGALGKLHALALWQPVVSGEAYVEELFAWQADWVRRTFPKPKPETLAGPCPEVLGFPLSEALLDDLKRLDLLALDQPPAPRALLVGNDEEQQARLDALGAHLAQLGADVTPRAVEAEPCWLGHAGGTIALVPVQVNQAIADWVAEVYR